MTQFLDLNEKIGGYDQDFNYVANRVVGDVGAIERAQQSGLFFNGNGGLASIPLMDISGIYNDDGGYHYQWFHFATRERMKEANGDTANHVMWRGKPCSGSSRVVDVHTVGGSGGCRQFRLAATRQGYPQQTADGGRWLLVRYVDVHRRVPDVRPAAQFAVQYAVSVVRVSAL